MKYYAGIGARDTHDRVLRQMTSIAHTLNGMEYTLRSGGAAGADSAFENGAAGNKQIFEARHATPASMMMASQFHPNWNACNQHVRKLHGRNMLILFGRRLDDPVDFIVCYTPGGAVTGGTGQALRAAEWFGIPVINLGSDEWDINLVYQYGKEMRDLRYRDRGQIINRSNAR